MLFTPLSFQFSLVGSELAPLAPLLRRLTLRRFRWNVGQGIALACSRAAHQTAALCVKPCAASRTLAPVIGLRAVPCKQNIRHSRAAQALHGAFTEGAAAVQQSWELGIASVSDMHVTLMGLRGQYLWKLTSRCVDNVREATGLNEGIVRKSTLAGKIERPGEMHWA